MNAHPIHSRPRPAIRALAAAFGVSLTGALVPAAGLVDRADPIDPRFRISLTPHEVLFSVADAGAADPSDHADPEAAPIRAPVVESGATEPAAAPSRETDDVTGVAWDDVLAAGTGIAPDAIDGDEPLERFRRSDTEAEAAAIALQVQRRIGLGDGAARRDEGLPNEADDRFGFAESGGGEFDVYDIDMRLRAASVGGVNVDWIGGLRAVRADVSTQRSASPNERSAPTLETERGVVAVPVVGTGVTWTIAPTVEVFGHATTNAGGDNQSLVDLTAAASIRISPTVDLVAGYQELRGRFDVRGIDAELDQRGLFARLRVRF